MSADLTRSEQLSQRLLMGLREINDISRHGETAPCLPQIINLCFQSVSRKMLAERLSGLAISAASACHSDNPEPSHVLRAMGISYQLAQQSLRFSLGRFTTESEIDQAIA